MYPGHVISFKQNISVYTVAKKLLNNKNDTAVVKKIMFVISDFTGLKKKKKTLVRTAVQQIKCSSFLGCNC